MHLIGKSWIVLETVASIACPGRMFDLFYGFIDSKMLCQIYLCSE